MDTQRNRDVLDREPELFARALTKITIVLALITLAVYATPPAGSTELKPITTGLVSGQGATVASMTPRFATK